MAEFKTPTSTKCKSRLDSAKKIPSLEIPPSPFLQKIGYGCGVNVFTLDRSPKAGFVRSPWAIKKSNQLSLDKKYDERIRLEAEILSKLNHPNIIGFRALAETVRGQPCLAMEKMEISLGDLIQEKYESEGREPFPAADIWRIGHEIAKGLEYLHHTMYILHGDVKSYNVLVTKDFATVKLCDFGVSLKLSKDLEVESEDSRYIGTECWSAPEIIHETGPITNKTDIWAYGIVIWEMITLSTPHVKMTADFEDEMETDVSMTEEEMLCGLNESSFSLGTVGTRPLLPAIDLDEEYRKVLEIFYACTDADYMTRPSAKGIVIFYNNYNDSLKRKAK